MSPSCVIHSIFVEHEGNPVEIRLSRRYRTELQGKAIVVLASQEHDSLLKEERVASFTTLFGKNGCGKTALLMELSQTFAEASKSKPLGVLFGLDGRLCLHKGQVLKEWELGAAGEPIRLAMAPPAQSIFYSSSPFEHARRASLKRLGVVEASPPFGSERQFDGLALALNYHHIGGDAAAICGDLNLVVKGRVSRARTVLTLVLDLLDRFGYDHERISLPHAKAAFAMWLREIPKAAEQVLLADLIIISDMEGNHNVVGRFVGDLMRLGQEIQDWSQEEAVWEVLAGLTEAAIVESRFIPFSGREVVEALGRMRRALSAKGTGNAFTVSASPARLKTALDDMEAWSPGAVRFLANLGFLEFTLKNLSSGEFAFLYLYAAIGSALERLKQTHAEGPVWLLIDEGEMFLHPTWQREYVNNILDFVGRFRRPELQIHVVISTHSLIVAADAPPYSLFDAEFGRPANGFALGPGATLSAVYGVDEFSGENTAHMIEELVAFLSDAKQQATDRIRKLAAAVADADLKDYVDRAMRERIAGH